MIRNPRGTEKELCSQEICGADEFSGLERLFSTVLAKEIIQLVLLLQRFLKNLEEI